MANSVQLDALLDIVDAMEEISIANGYATDVATVVQRFLDWETGRLDVPLPAIGVVPGEARYEEQSVPTASTSVVRVRTSVSIQYVYAAETQTEVWQSGYEMADDIIAAVSVDRTRSGNALTTRIVSVETDAGNADTMDSRGGTAAGIVFLELDFWRKLTVS